MSRTARAAAGSSSRTLGILGIFPVKVRTAAMNVSAPRFPAKGASASATARICGIVAASASGGSGQMRAASPQPAASGWSR